MTPPVRPVLVREARLPRLSPVMLQKQLGLLGMALVAMLLLATCVISTAFVLYPPERMAEVPVTTTVATHGDVRGIWVRVVPATR